MWVLLRQGLSKIQNNWLQSGTFEIRICITLKCTSTRDATPIPLKQGMCKYLHSTNRKKQVIQMILMLLFTKRALLNTGQDPGIRIQVLCNKLQCHMDVYVYWWQRPRMKGSYLSVRSWEKSCILQTCLYLSPYHLYCCHYFSSA